MADISKLTSFMNAYGIGVRAGSITPCVEDEGYIRQLFNLPEMSSAIVADWKSTGGIRRPITLVKEEEPAQQQATEATNEEN